MRRHVIVGGGIAGLSAAEALRAVDSGADITLIGAESHPFYSRPGLAYLLAGEVPERQLTLRSAPELRELALDRVVDQVTAIDTAAHTVTLAHHEPLGWDRLLIATGAAAVAPDFPGAELDGVVQLGSLGDARRIIELSRGASAAVVVGGGPTAVELAEGLAARGLHVHYLLRGGRYFADVLDVVESRLVEEALQRQGIELHHHTRIGRVLGKAGRVSAVETATGAILPCRLVAVATGVRPRLEMARAAACSSAASWSMSGLAPALRMSSRRATWPSCATLTPAWDGSMRCGPARWRPAAPRARPWPARRSRSGPHPAST